MDIEQAKQHMADFTSNAIRGGLNVYDVLNFSMDFLDLMHERKMSPGNEALFANITALFIWCIFRPHPDTDSGNIRTA
jgi:hypothetical protein